MVKKSLYGILGLMLFSCIAKNNPEQTIENMPTNPQTEHLMEKEINPSLPTIGILVFEGVIINEVVAPLDVFSNPDEAGQQLFNVITIGKENTTYKSAHGLKISPDYVIGQEPKLEVLVVPSSYNPSDQTSDQKLVNFVREQNKTTEYMASHCAGAFLVGEAGVADNKEIVTYFGGGEALQADYPNLKVADDSKVSVVQDGKLISSNGSMVSYIASFDLLEQMTSKEHRAYVEAYILFDRIKE